MNEYLKVLRTHYADFSGRTRRREYWLFTLVNTVISFVLALPFLLSSAAASADGGAGSLSGLALGSTVLASIYTLAVFVPSLAVVVRRLHDTGKSGWWYLLSFIPLGSLAVLVFLLLDGEPGANKWGPNPKGMVGGASAANW
ncbi:membrane protein [Deinococcus radiopugnans]|uniref:Membrane protein n=1 Tax=Deinococcus radiopugnans TaxID=57497 RepID=A0A0A7KHL3_9DEIO|nr:DUF805 domain-containing protein [Deinococcus radiopugnans]AIZ44038.1 membrane protein [Deinococcus radiopugnans]